MRCQQPQKQVWILMLARWMDQTAAQRVLVGVLLRHEDRQNRRHQRVHLNVAHLKAYHRYHFRRPALQAYHHVLYALGCGLLHKYINLFHHSCTEEVLVAQLCKIRYAVQCLCGATSLSCLPQCLSHPTTPKSFSHLAGPSSDPVCIRVITPRF